MTIDGFKKKIKFKRVRYKILSNNVMAENRNMQINSYYPSKIKRFLNNKSKALQSV